MLTKNKIPLLVLAIACLELVIYLWAVWTSTLSADNFFAIEPEFIFDKCARNSGRISSVLNLIILVMIGYDGLQQIYLDEKKRDAFRILITVFAVNHLVHFFYVFQNFKHHTIPLNISDNKHGFIAFIGVLLVPVILWVCKKLNWILYVCIIAHLFNVSYFIMETFYNKITPEKPAYHNQFGIAITTAACVYVLWSIYRDFKRDKAIHA